jgi:uncharacterized protein (TIGR03067 family)
VSKHLPARPNLDHLKKQAKSLLAALKDGDSTAASTFIEHMPAARKLTAAKVRTAGFRLADSQSVVARQTGFPSWNALARHVQLLTALQGEWQFVSLQVDGRDMPAELFTTGRLMMDGSRFRKEGEDANYDGEFSIDVEAEPHRIDIEFTEGPEAGNSCFGIFELNGDQLRMCIGVVGASRPVAFKSAKGSGHALERLRRVSAGRQIRVTGGTRQPKRTSSETAAPPVDSTGFDATMTPLLQRLQGEWSAVSLIRDGEETKKEWLPYGSRVTAGNEMKVIFGGQVMAHARIRFDESVTPVAVDALNLAGSQKGKVSLGIMDWVGDDVRFVTAVPGQPRPTTFTAGKGLTLSQWRKT